MLRKTEVELAKAATMKAYRAAIRLKYALLADEELNETLPAVEAEFDRAVAAGKPFTLRIGEVFSE